MVILHQDPNGFRRLSPAEAQDMGKKFRSWSDKVHASGRYVVSDKLMEEGGKVLTGQNGRVTVTDGPYSEAKEVVGGYLTLRAGSYEEALELLCDCPHLAFGRLEVRQTDPMGCGEE
jgi:hypothetical protein